MTIAVLAALSSTTFAVGLPTDYSQTQTLSGNYEIAEDITISKQGYLPKILFQTSEDGAHISLTGDTSIKLIDGGDSRGGALFVNNTDKKLTFDVNFR